MPVNGPRRSQAIGHLEHLELKPSPTEELLQLQKLFFGRVANSMQPQAHPSKDHQG